MTDDTDQREQDFMDETVPKCHSLGIDPGLKCTPEMISLCEQEDSVRCDGHGNKVGRSPIPTAITDSWEAAADDREEVAGLNKEILGNES